MLILFESRRKKYNGFYLIAMVILISIAYTNSTLRGQTLKRQGLQWCIARPESKAPSQKRHSAFRVGFSAYQWAINGDLQASDRNQLYSIRSKFSIV